MSSIRSADERGELLVPEGMGEEVCQHCDM